MGHLLVAFLLVAIVTGVRTQQIGSDDLNEELQSQLDDSEINVSETDESYHFNEISNTKTNNKFIDREAAAMDQLFKEMNLKYNDLDINPNNLSPGNTVEKVEQLLQQYRRRERMRMLNDEWQINEDQILETNVPSQDVRKRQNEKILEVGSNSQHDQLLMDDSNDPIPKTGRRNQNDKISIWDRLSRDDPISKADRQTRNYKILKDGRQTQINPMSTDDGQSQTNKILEGDSKNIDPVMDVDAPKMNGLSMMATSQNGNEPMLEVRSQSQAETISNADSQNQKDPEIKTDSFDVRTTVENTASTLEDDDVNTESRPELAQLHNDIATYDEGPDEVNDEIIVENNPINPFIYMYNDDVNEQIENKEIDQQIINNYQEDNQWIGETETDDRNWINNNNDQRELMARRINSSNRNADPAVNVQERDNFQDIGMPARPQGQLFANNQRQQLPTRNLLRNPNRQQPLRIAGREQQPGNARQRNIRRQEPERNPRRPQTPGNRWQEPPRDPRREEPTRNTRFEEPTRDPRLEEPRRNPRRQESPRNFRSQEPPRNPRRQEPPRNPRRQEPPRNPRRQEPSRNPRRQEPPSNPRRNIRREEPQRNPRIQGPPRNPRRQQPPINPRRLGPERNIRRQEPEINPPRQEPERNPRQFNDQDTGLGVGRRVRRQTFDDIPFDDQEHIDAQFDRPIVRSPPYRGDPRQSRRSSVTVDGWETLPRYEPMWSEDESLSRNNDIPLETESRQTLAPVNERTTGDVFESAPLHWDQQDNPASQTVGFNNIDASNMDYSFRLDRSNPQKPDVSGEEPLSWNYDTPITGNNQFDDNDLMSSDTDNDIYPSWDTSMQNGERRAAFSGDTGQPSRGFMTPETRRTMTRNRGNVRRQGDRRRNDPRQVRGRQPPRQRRPDPRQMRRPTRQGPTRPEEPRRPRGGMFRRMFG